MALTLHMLLVQCRLLLRRSRVSFAERKTTFRPSDCHWAHSTGIGFVGPLGLKGLKCTNRWLTPPAEDMSALQA